VDLALPLVADPLVNDIACKDAAAEEEFIVGLQRVEHFGQAAGGALDFRTTLGSVVREHLVQVLVDRIWWLDLIDHTIESSHQHRRKREVRIARRIRSADFHTADIWAAGWRATAQ